MKDTKIISFIGMEKCDIPYYLSVIMDKYQYRTLVIDNSISHDLFSSLKVAEENTRYVEHDRTVFMKNIAFSPEAFAKFDLVIVYHGFNIDQETLKESNKVIIMTDYFKSTLQKFQMYVDMAWLQDYIPVEKTILLYRDKLSNKVSEKYINEQIGILKVDEDFIIGFDEGNTALYFNFTYNGEQNPKNISGEMKSFLFHIRDEILGKSRKKMSIEEEED